MRLRQDVPLLNDWRFLRLLRLLVICIPMLLLVLIVNVNYGQSIKNYKPHFPNDEVNYYRQGIAFSEVGFDTGYFTLDELPASASFTHYGPHGPAYPILYGTIIKIAGDWQPYKGIYFNVCLMMLALGFYMVVVQPDVRQLTLIALSLATFYPLLLNLFSTMQEMFHQSVAICFAAIIMLLWRRTNLSFAAKTSAIILITAASLMRFTWSLVFIVFFVSLIREVSLKRVILAGFIGGIAALFSFLIFPCRSYLDINDNMWV